MTAYERKRTFLSNFRQGIIPVTAGAMRDYQRKADIQFNVPASVSEAPLIASLCNTYFAMSLLKPLDVISEFILAFSCLLLTIMNTVERKFYNEASCSAGNSAASEPPAHVQKR